MKNILFIILLGSIITLFPSCKKNVNKKTMTVVRNCTGTYLNYQEKDYQVCNTSVTDGYKAGEKVEASFTKIDDCTALKEKVICQMIHKNEGFVNVTSIE